MSQFKAYPAYKHSGVEWLGEVPSHWRVESLKRCCNVFPSNVDKKSYEGQIPVRLCNYTDVYYNEKIDAGIEFMSATATQEQISKFSLRAGDVIFTKDSETADDIAIAAYVPFDLPGVICGYHLSMARPSADADGRFVKCFFDSHSAKAYFAISANGLTRVGLSQYATDNVPLPLPPPPEQTQIARFLDHETDRIDTLIEEQQRLIELLKEKRQAVISNSVTKGLDPSVPMKDSGVKWLGEVPAHWDVKKLKNITLKIIDGAHFTPTYVDEGIPFLRVTDIQTQDLDMDSLKRIPEDEHRALIKRCNPAKGDVLLSKNGTIGITKVVDWDFDFSIFVSLCLIKPAQSVSSKYLLNMLSGNSALEQFNDSGQKTSVTNLHLEKIREVFVALPRGGEQAQISNFIDQKTGELDKLISEAKCGITLLQERRSALISAAVTGKIDVRGWQPPSRAQAPVIEEEAV
ncbi:restriction endonuclease subunit S [Pseudomonas marincola]|uniref:restriction endonuclease subunit S n=1 Tax=Pseudomonas marincola TaxID=437900 RepID=UPI0008F15C7F|nr:restriction endonuclease subunit S [Pseudomonas marincola]SFU02089.1 type I restriction enzyme, S subunit [Pseudomonas marincola]